MGNFTTPKLVLKVFLTVSILGSCGSAHGGFIRDTVFGGICNLLVARAAKQLPPPPEGSHDAVAMLIHLGNDSVPLEMFLGYYQKVLTYKSAGDDFLSFVSRFPTMLRFQAALVLINERYMTMKNVMLAQKWIEENPSDHSVKRTSAGAEHLKFEIELFQSFKEQIDPYHQLDAVASRELPQIHGDQILVLGTLFGMEQASRAGEPISLPDLLKHMKSDHELVTSDDLQRELSLLISAGLASQSRDERFAHTAAGKSALVKLFAFYSRDHFSSKSTQ